MPNEAVNPAGHRSVGGKRGCFCDINIGDGDTAVLERNDGTTGIRARKVDPECGG